ncbi:MAG: hypothetical protein H6728_08350 [Myxococcales bacterium]|nr:hypothetical protein [Myxococcales bacterium]
MSWQEQLTLFEDKKKRWLLIAGSHLGATSGVPLPFQRTSWSPSIADLVRYHIFRTQSREVAESVEKALQSGKAPLGFISDQLPEQVKWFRNYTNNLTPQKNIVRLADLARSEMFCGVVSSAADDLLEQALDRQHVAYELLSLEKPLSGGDALHFVKEWDDLIFQDQEDRRNREAAFVKQRLEGMLDGADGVIVIGQHPYPSDMMNGFLRLVVAKPDVPVVWVEDLRYDHLTEGLPQAQTSVQWLSQYHKSFHRVSTENVGGFLDDITQQRGVEPTPIFDAEVELPSGLNALLNRSINLKPILIFMPGGQLFSGLLDKLPQVSLRSILGVIVLFILFLGFLNYRDYDQYNDKLDGVRGKTLVARLTLGKATPTPKAVVNAEGYLDRGVDLLKKATLPKTTRLSFPYLDTYLQSLREKVQKDMEKLRADKVIPHLYRYRLRSQLEAHPLLGSMGRFPEVYVSLEQSEVQDVQESGASGSKKSDDASKKTDSGSSSGTDSSGAEKKREEKGRDELESSRQIRPLAEHKTKPLLALYVSGSTLNQVLMTREMLKDTIAGRLVIPVDLSKLKNDSIEQTVVQVVRDMTGYSGDRAGLFRFEGVEQVIKSGNASFYFLQLDQAGSLANIVPKVLEFVERYEKSRAILSTYQERNFAALESLAPRFVRLKQQTYENRIARDFLHKQTSTAFFRELMNNGYLSQNINRPLILSLCIQYYLLVGRAPRNLGVIYDRLVRNMLDGGAFEMTLKVKILSALAFRSMQLNRSTVPRDEALEIIEQVAKLDLQQSSKLLREMVGHGVLRILSVGDVGFMDKHFRLLGASYQIAKLPFAEQKRFLPLQERKIMSFFAGVHPALSRLVGAWLQDFAKIDQTLRKRGKYDDWINPYLYVLPYAALAVNNGEVEQRYVKRLETLLFSLMEHRRIKAMRGIVEYSLRSLSTPGVKAWILQGLDQDVSYDGRLLRLARHAPSDIYVSSIQRWLRRLRTAEDHQEARHAFPKNKAAVEESGSVQDAERRGARRGRFGRRFGRLGRTGGRLGRAGGRLGRAGGRLGRLGRGVPTGDRPARGPLGRGRRRRPRRGRGPFGGLGAKKGPRPFPSRRDKPSVRLAAKPSVPAVKGPARPRYVSSRLRVSMLMAFLALSHVGTSEAIQTIFEHATRSEDPRFLERDWRTIRFRAFYVLLTKGHAERILPVYRKLLNGDQREYWMGLLRFFNRVNSREAAKILIDFLKVPGAFKMMRAYGKLLDIPYKERRKQKDYYKQRAATRKEYYKGRKILSNKERIARTLARFDDDLVIPLLKEMLRDGALSWTLSCSLRWRWLIHMKTNTFLWS